MGNAGITLGNGEVTASSDDGTFWEHKFFEVSCGVVVVDFSHLDIVCQNPIADINLLVAVVMELDIVFAFRCELIEGNVACIVIDAAFFSIAGFVRIGTRGSSAACA